jgi:hypothetical protein
MLRAAAERAPSVAAADRHLAERVPQVARVPRVAQVLQVEQVLQAERVPQVALRSTVALVRPKKSVYKPPCGSLRRAVLF